jgi:hypothetical protein
VHPIITVYKSSYETYAFQGDGHSEAYRKNIRYLQPFTGGKEERLRYLQRINNATDCSSAGESKKNLLPLAKALYEEALGLVSTEDDMKIVNNLRFSMENIDIGYEAAERRDIERRRGQK